MIISTAETGDFIDKYQVALGAELAALGVELVALDVELDALGVELAALGVELAALGVELVTLGVELVTLGVELVAFSPSDINCGFHLCVLLDLGLKGSKLHNSHYDITPVIQPLQQCISTAETDDFIDKYQVALGVELAALGVELAALGVELVSLGVELVALGVELVALGVDLVALGVELAALGVELVAFSPSDIDCGFHLCVLLDLGLNQL
jgi:uncharacterized membrane protein